MRLVRWLDSWVKRNGHGSLNFGLKFSQLADYVRGLLPRWTYVRIRDNFISYPNGEDSSAPIVELGTNVANLLK